MKKLNLSPDKILHKKFSTEISGYNAAEVDQYFDLILEDMQTLINEQKRLEAMLTEKSFLINDKEQEIEKLNLQIVNLKDQVAEANKNTNYELVKKIEELTTLTKSNLK